MSRTGCDGADFTVCNVRLIPKLHKPSMLFTSISEFVSIRKHFVAESGKILAHKYPGSLRFRSQYTLLVSPLT